MEIDQLKFMNLVMEKTNKRLNDAIAQVIVLESQLQLAVETNQKLSEELNKQSKNNKCRNSSKSASKSRQRIINRRC